MSAPKRRYTLTIEVGADNYEDMLTALDNWVLMMRMEHPELSENHSGVTGGPDYGHTYDIVVNPDMDHDKYFEEVERWLSERRESWSG